MCILQLFVSQVVSNYWIMLLINYMIEENLLLYVLEWSPVKEPDSRFSVRKNIPKKEKERKKKKEKAERKRVAPE